MNQKNISIYFSNDLKIRCAYLTVTNFFFFNVPSDKTNCFSFYFYYCSLFYFDQNANKK